MDLAYGPVPSRRLGRSLGINDIPPKTCTYACIYCQLGPTTATGTERQEFYDPEAIESAVEERVAAVREADESIDYLSIVPDGEPTLDANLGETIDRIRRFGIDVAVITNGSLIDRPDVRADLSKADYVSVKVDAGRAETWREIDRPHGALSFTAITRGLRTFAESFEGTLTTETMLVDGVNDGADDLRATADLVGEVDPDVAYVAIPTRPPAEEWVEPASETAVGMAYRLFEEQVDDVEYLIGAEPDDFASTGDVEADILGVTAVHPMRESGLRDLLDRADADWSVIEDLLASGELIEREFGDERFFMRPITTVEE
ncbi:MAG: wyosine [tRNA(Phe)-imidazoG37] synthetase (radical SAM superfamily) [Halobacteriales archaeon]|jgi:wyosine [tRNA(Phe)-imidazoG37] synthetase (radical SAM superfamily)|uniref:radical SAM protein n=1 Tax=Natronomonas sp. TaxID=2184060 RepID=UPI003989B7A5